MSDNWQEEIRALLAQSRVSFLATQGRYGPETSMAPFAIHQRHILLHLSQLAAHSTNIENCNNVGLMICTPETSGSSPLSLPRLALQGEVRPVADDEFEQSKATYLRAISDAEPLFGFGDFCLFQFKAARIHWVGGFGRARRITPGQWQSITMAL